jgi:hypothetical protein
MVFSFIEWLFRRYVIPVSTERGVGTLRIIYHILTTFHIHLLPITRNSPTILLQNQLLQTQATKRQTKPKPPIHPAQSNHDSPPPPKHPPLLSLLEPSHPSFLGMQKLQQDVHPSRMVEGIHGGDRSFRTAPYWV